MDNLKHSDSIVTKERFFNGYTKVHSGEFVTMADISFILPIYNTTEK
jgi:hypothetical protein